MNDNSGGLRLSWKGWLLEADRGLDVDVEGSFESGLAWIGLVWFGLLTIRDHGHAHGSRRSELTII